MQLTGAWGGEHIHYNLFRSSWQEHTANTATLVAAMADQSGSIDMLLDEQNEWIWEDREGSLCFL